ncbi:MAG: serine protease AprX [Saprospiraceae bacterium]|jgi:serine protease AprX
MEVNSIRSILLVIMFLSNWVVSAQNRYIVYFPDKTDSQYSIDNPVQFLSQRAIDRRIHHDILISEQDFPVSQKYLDSLAKYNVKSFFTSRWMNCALIQIDEEKLKEITGKAFIQSIEYVAPGTRLLDNPKVFDSEYVPNEPGSITRTSEVQLGMLHANSMHRAGYKGEGIKIAILDGGFIGADSSIIFKHLYEGNKIVDKVDYISGGTNVFQYDDHGTNVFSCLGSDFGFTMKGTAPNADYSLFVTEEPEHKNEYRVEEYNWLFAVERADSSGVDIISSSLGYNTFEDPTMDYLLEDLDGKTAIITRAADIAFSKGMLVVVSAGNSGGDSSWEGKINFPADANNVLSVGAVNDKNEVAGFSSKGPSTDDRIKPELVARGVATTVLHGSGNIGFNNGTSFATPLVAGFAAGVWQYRPDLTNVELLELLKTSGDTYDTPGNERGYGLPTFSKITGDILLVDEVLLDKVRVFPNPFTNNTIHIRIPSPFESKSIEFSVYNSKGKLVGKKKVNNPKPAEIIELNVKSRAIGVYFLTINSAQFTKQVKLIKY